MKKRVRIYGPGKSTTWKAQEGGTQQQPQYTDEQLVSIVMTIIGEQGGSPEDALNQLVQAGVDQARANQIVSSAVSYINDQAEMNNAEMSSQGYEANKLAEEDEALNQQAQDDQEEEARQQRYQQMMASNDEDTTDYGDDQDVVSSMMAKFGGVMPSKRSFVKNVMKLTKKQMGGDGTSNKADDTDTGERKGGLNDFITGLQTHANDALIKQDAEALYDQYQDLDNDMDYGYDIDQDYMQLGGMRPGQMRRMNRRANRMMGQIPAGVFNNRTQMFPSQMNIIGMPMIGPQGFVMPDQGSYQGGPRLANIDVRRIGLFGRPKEYTVTFAQEAYANPQLRQDVIKQEQNNQKQKAKEIWTEVKEEVDNTATEKNAEVKAEADKNNVTTSTDTKAIQDQGSSTTNNGTQEANTEITKIKDKPKVEVKKIEEKTKVEPDVKSEDFMHRLSDVVFNPGNRKAGYLKVDGKWYLSSNYASDKDNKDLNWTEVTDPARIKNIEKFKPSPYYSTAGYYQYLDDTPYLYSVDPNGNWSYTVPNDNGILPKDPKSFPVKDKKTLAKLNTSTTSGKGTKGATLGTLKTKPGYYYRQLNDGSYAKFKGDTIQHYVNKKPVALIKKDKNNAQWNYLNDNFLPSGRYVTGDMKQFGGMTMEDSGLYKFVYGGNDPISTPFEKNTADPYFQMGGYYQDGGGHWSNGEWVEGIDPRDVNELKGNIKTNLSNRENYEKAKAAGVNVGEYRDGIRYEDLHKFPKMVNSGVNLPYNNPYTGNMYNPQVGAMYPPLFGGGRQFGPAGRTIQYAGSWAQQQGMAFDPRTGQPVNPAMMGNLPLSKIDVTKSSLFGKRPKEYTMYFGDYSGAANGQTPSASMNEGPESRIKGMFRRLTEKGFSKPEVSSTGLHDKNDEKYKEIYGHYPGEDENPVVDNNQIGTLPTKEFTPFEFPQNELVPGSSTQPNMTDNSVPRMQTKKAEQLDLESIQNERAPQTFRDYNSFPTKDMSDDYALDKEYEFQDSLPLNVFTGTGPVDINQFAAANGELPYSPAENIYNYGDENQMADQEYDLERMRMENPDIYNEYPYNKDVLMNQNINDAFAAVNQLNNQKQPKVNRRAPIRTNTRTQTQTVRQTNRKQQAINKTIEGNAFNELLAMRDSAAGNDPRTFRKAAQQIDASGKKIFNKMSNSQKLSYLKQLKKIDKNLYDGYLTLLQEGGTLPQAQNGTVGLSDVEVMPELKPRAYQDVWESVEPEVRKSWGLEEKEPEIDRTNPGYAAKFKNKNMYNIDFERGLNQFNAAADWGMQKLGEIGQRGITRNFYDNLTGDNLYGSTNLEDRGTYDTNSGLFRPDQMGFKGIVRNGGFLQDGGYNEPMYNEDEEAYMTQDEIDQFLADGGELEYL